MQKKIGTERFKIEMITGAGRKRTNPIVFLVSVTKLR